ncbi:uncharacterized protein LOC133717648 [Rosa rugosa]|uniref:uncharacterized protein LOC133717648 n=1 Tax=Rosa rugosa TaxID=74645 RepID=UPI002B40E564|nr:uncharacterized protein LOC133717648 [Rosa rugosa]
MKKEDALDCYFYTSSASHESILSPLWVAKDTGSEDWFIFYERFTPFTQINWNQTDETKLYTSAGNLLKVLKYMYDSLLVHKHMDNLDNYVVHKGMVKLINIHAKCRMGDNGWCQDLIGLTESFDVILPQTRLAERKCFIDFLTDTSKMPR